MPKPIVCIGAALVDELFHASEEILMHTTNEVTVTRTAGGVSRNIAHQLSLLNIPIQIITVFGDDADGKWLKETCEAAGIKTDASITNAPTTGKYTGIIDADGSMFTALLTNAALHLITPDYLLSHSDLLKNSEYILVDANISKESMQWLINFTNENHIRLIIEPVSVPPAKKLAGLDLKGVYLLTPNEDELPAICVSNASTVEAQVLELLQRGVKNVWLHKGKLGSAIYNLTKTIELKAPDTEVVDCTGAGDGSVSGFIMSKYLGKDDESSLKIAHTLSGEILQVNGAIATHLNQEKLISLVTKYYPNEE